MQAHFILLVAILQSAFARPTLTTVLTTTTPATTPSTTIPSTTRPSLATNVNAQACPAVSTITFNQCTATATKVETVSGSPVTSKVTETRLVTVSASTFTVFSTMTNTQAQSCSSAITVTVTKRVTLPNGSFCASNSDCDANLCNSAKKCGQVADGSTCTFADECTSNKCISGQCGLTPDGGKCTTAAQCTANYCSGLGTCGQVGDGEPCKYNPKLAINARGSPDCLYGHFCNPLGYCGKTKAGDPCDNNQFSRRLCGSGACASETPGGPTVCTYSSLGGLCAYNTDCLQGTCGDSTRSGICV